MTKTNEEYIEVLNKIADCVDHFINKETEYIRYILHTASGNQYKINYNRGSLPHLLGVNTNYLRSTRLYEGSSYQILEEVLDNSNFLYQQMKNGHIKKENVFSEHIDTKLSSFEDICSVNIFDIEFIVEYDSKRSYTTGETKLDGDLYIAYRKKTNESGTINVIGYRQNEDGLYYPMTNLEYTEHTKEARDFFKRLLTNQKVTIASNLKRNYLNKDNKVISKDFYYPTDIRKTKTKILKRYEENYDCIIDVSRDYIYQTESISNLKSDKALIYDVLDNISESIHAGKEIDLESFKKRYQGLANSIVNLINTYNEALTHPKNNTEKYNDLKQQIVETQKSMTQKDTLIKKLEDKTKSLVEENKNIKQENQELKDKQDQVRKILG